MKRVCIALLCGVAAAAILQSAIGAMPAIAAEYQLGPADKLKIRVYDWRPGTDDTHEWTAVTGEFVVGPSGTLSLPIVGEMKVGHATTTQVEQKLAAELQAKLGLAQPPYASIQIAEYRPFYITGFVEKPGEYAYRPGLTVLQAVSIAGGGRRVPEMNLLSVERDAITSRGDMRAMEAERLQLLVRQARLKAQVDDVSVITLPAELATRKSEPDVARLINEETDLLETYRSSLNSQLAIFQQTKQLLLQEVKTLAAKEVSLSRQYDLTKRDLDAVASLVSRGLAVTPRQTALEQNLAQFESTRLDLQLQQLRAQQDIARIDRETIEARNKSKSQALIDANEARARLAALIERIKASASLVYQSEVRAPDEIASLVERETATPVYYVAHESEDGSAVAQLANANDQILPGDTIRVDRPQPTQRLSNVTAR